MAWPTACCAADSINVVLFVFFLDVLCIGVLESRLILHVDEFIRTGAA